MTKEDVRDIIKSTISIEGGYVNDPNDRGGETIFGISRNNFPNWEGWARVDQFAHKNTEIGISRLESCADIMSMAIDFYLNEFFKPNKLHMLDKELGKVLFDIGVNQGLKTSAKHLQKTINLIIGSEILVIDGIIGEETMKKLNLVYDLHLDKYGDASEIMIQWIKFFQMERYKKIIDNDKSQKKYLIGWTRRARI